MSKKVIRYLLIGIALFALVNISEVNAGRQCMPSCPSIYAECVTLKDECEQKIASGLGGYTGNITVSYTSEDARTFNCNNPDIIKAVTLVSRAFNIVKIIVPVIIVIVGMISFSKAIIAQEDTEIKSAFYGLLRKLAIGAIIYFLPTIAITIIKTSVDGYSRTDNSWVRCIDAIS